MVMLNIKFKRLHEHARLPTQTMGDIGFDLYAVERTILHAFRSTPVKTGLAIADYEPKQELVADVNFQRPIVSFKRHTVYPKIEGRSGLSLKGIFPIGGIIDPGYRGELCVTLANITDSAYVVMPGDRIAQMVFYLCHARPEVTMEEMNDIVPTERGDRGFGSSGR